MSASLRLAWTHDVFRASGNLLQVVNLICLADWPGSSAGDCRYRQPDGSCADYRGGHGRPCSPIFLPLGSKHGVRSGIIGISCNKIASRSPLLTPADDSFNVGAPASLWRWPRRRRSAPGHRTIRRAPWPAAMAALSARIATAAGQVGVSGSRPWRPRGVLADLDVARYATPTAWHSTLSTSNSRSSWSTCCAPRRERRRAASRRGGLPGGRASQPLRVIKPTADRPGSPAEREAHNVSTPTTHGSTMAMTNQQRQRRFDYDDGAY